MSAPIPAEQFAAVANRVAPPAFAKPNRVGRQFDLHPALHLATFGGFFAYLGIMWLAFGNPELVLPFVIFVAFLAASLIVPAYWERVAHQDGPKQSFAEFLQEGVECATGHVTARQTMVQVLIMPAMLVFWGLSVALIRALV